MVIYNWSLKKKVGFDVDNPSIKFEVKVWGLKLKLKIEIEIWCCGLRLRFKAEVWSSSLIMKFEAYS